MNRLQKNRLYGANCMHRPWRDDFVSWYVWGEKRKLANGLRVVEPVREFKTVRRAKQNWRHTHRKLPMRLCEAF